jgi:hypothetical protein
MMSLAEAAKAFRSHAENAALESTPSSALRGEVGMRTIAEAAKAAVAAVSKREKELLGCFYAGGASFGESPSVSSIRCTR